MEPISVVIAGLVIALGVITAGKVIAEAIRQGMTTYGELEAARHRVEDVRQKLSDEIGKASREHADGDAGDDNLG